jgi:hypothetical protein
MYKCTRVSKTNKNRFHLFFKKSVLFWSQQEIEWIVLWEALIRSSRGSSLNTFCIVIILLVFPAVWMSLRDYLRIYSGKVFML